MPTTVNQLDGKVAAVTGAARGIGRGIAQTLADRGASVVIVDVNAEAVTTAAQEIGQVHILVNNAGINRDGMLHKMSDEQWHQVIEVDLSGVFYMCREIGTHMRAHQYGRIVNIASASWMGNVGQTNYAAAKGGAVSLTRSIAKELAFKNVTANAVCPGSIDTDMTRAMPKEAHDQMLARIPLRRIGQPEDVARTVAFLASDDAAYVTGEVITVGGGSGCESPHRHGRGGRLPHLRRRHGRL